MPNGVGQKYREMVVDLLVGRGGESMKPVRTKLTILLINEAHIAAIFIAIGISGCAVSGSVKNTNSAVSGFDGATYKGETRLIANESELKKYSGSEQFRVFEQGATGYSSIPEVRDQAMPKTVEFCRAMGKEPKVLKEQTSVPPHILGNFPRIEITFVCVGKSEEKSNSGGSDDRYVKLSQLKALLDNGTITKEEFEKEKRKILYD